MIQALTIGTPTFSTTFGIEGFDIHYGEELLVADDPVEFANAIARLMHDDDLWRRLAVQGRTRITAEHGRDTARVRLLESLSAVLARPERTMTSSFSNSRTSQREYQQIIRRTKQHVEDTAPE